MERKRSQKNLALEQLAYHGLVPKKPTPEQVTSAEQGRQGRPRPVSPELGFFVEKKVGATRKRRSRKRSRRHKRN